METKNKEEVSQKAEKPRLKRFFLNFGKLILDATKLSFGSLVLGTIIKGDLPQSMVMFWGIVASVAGALMGLVIVSLSEEK